MTETERSTPPDDAWTSTVCLIGQGAKCCRFLARGSNGWTCEKHTALGRILDARAEGGQLGAQGDNCEGRASA